MTIFATIRSLTFLARDAFEAALYLIPAPGLSGYDDAADALAEREAAVDASDPWDCPLCGWPIPMNDDSECGMGGDFPPPGDDAPTPPDHPSYPQTNGLNSANSSGPRDDCGLVGRMDPAPGSYISYGINADGCSDPVFHSAEHPDLLARVEPAAPVRIPWVDIRAAAVGIEQWMNGDRCPEHNHTAWGLIVERLHVFANEVHQPHAPVASASPQTPADATGSDPTLANDPDSVQRRHMRRLLGEDQGRP